MIPANFYICVFELLYTNFVIQVCECSLSSNAQSVHYFIELIFLSQVLQLLAFLCKYVVRSVKLNNFISIEWDSPKCSGVACLYHEI